MFKAARILGLQGYNVTKEHFEQLDHFIGPVLSREISVRVCAIFIVCNNIVSFNDVRAQVSLTLQKKTKKQVLKA